MAILNINQNNVHTMPVVDKLVMGFFDGVHLGHLNLLNQPHTTLLTFNQIPRKTTNLFSKTDRIEFFNQLNLDNVLFYDILSSNMTGKEFIEKILKPLNPNQIIVGENFSFGKDGQSAYFLQQHFPNVKIVKIKHHISTSSLRYWLTANKPDFKKIAKWLTIPYFRSGTVAKGYQDGRKLGIPTANIEINHQLIDLMEGVYLTKVELNNQVYQGLTFWGKAQTMNHHKNFIETHLINYEGPEFYNQTIKITFLKYLRKSKKFKSKLQLLQAIKKDYQKAAKYFQKNHI